MPNNRSDLGDMTSSMNVTDGRLRTTVRSLMAVLEPVQSGQSGPGIA